MTFNDLEVDDFLSIYSDGGKYRYRPEFLVKSCASL